jgi:E3 ubiquitin-protein ligase SHPRH
MIKYSDLLPIVKHTNECDNPNELTSTLLGFQKAAVNWMLLSETSYKPLPLWIPHDGQFKHIYTDEVKPQMTWKHNGGILADEMGLGKTLMAISLILLHKAPHVCPNPATLIITPISILYQWIQEIETHCPTLKLLHYKGSTPAINFCEYDVVLVSIETCRKEIHFARPRSSMKRRREPVFNYPMSPLVNVTWWRVILDEAQLMGSFASLAYEMGMRIPRTNVWVVTGTPCPSGDFKDIYPLLHFIGIGEYFKARTDNLAALVDSLSYYMHANTKTNVGNELVLPNQRDERLFMDFDRVESVHYKDLWHQALNTIKVKHETYKTALMSNNHSKDLEKALEKAHEELLNAMKSWSLRMRQTCCHPQLSTHNQRTLGNSIMTMSSVLAFMIKAATSEWYSNRRLLILENIRHAQLLELQGQLEKSLQIYQSQQKEIGQELQILLESADFCESDDDQSDAEGEGIESSQQRVRSWRILEHAIYFFIASNYHNQQALLDQNDKLKSTIEAYETQNYKIAADKRSLILARYEANFKRSLDKEIENPQVPFLETQFTGGILSHVVFDDLHSLFDTLNDQCAVIDEWRSKIINNISKPLDHEDQATGDEFINSVETQDEGMIYQDLYSQMISARRYLIAGTKSLFPTIKCGKNQKLMAQELSKYQKYPQSFKGALGELTKLKSHHYSSESEIQLIDYAIKNLNELYQNQLKAQVKLEG